MGFWDWIRGVDSYDPAQRVLPEPYEPFMSTAGIPVMDPGSPLEWWTGHRSEVERFWRTQPNLRKVVDFIARSVASVPLNAYERVSDTDRQRLRGEPLSDILRSPQPRLAPYRFWHSVLSDGLLYDRWAVFVHREGGRLNLVQIPSNRLRFEVDPLRRVTAVKYWAGKDADLTSDKQWIDVPLEELVFDFGYSPTGAGLSPVQTLRDILDESAEAVAYRRDVWSQGVRVPGYVYRPPTPTAPRWDDAQRNRFVNALRSSYGRTGPDAGGLPLMEDGMEIRSTDVFTPRDSKDLEGRQLTAIEVAAAFHIAPELVGAREGTFSNIDAFRQMMFGPSLGPYIDAWQGALNAQLVPMFSGDREVYVEANVESKLRGSFIEQARIMQSATGGPWLTRNEARALQNRSPLDGADELIVPMNVTEGGQASPNDSGSQNQNAGEATVKALETFLRRQGAVVMSSLGSKDKGQWWDAKRWNAELASDLSLSTTDAGRINAETKALVEASADPLGVFGLARARNLAALIDN